MICGVEDSLDMFAQDGYFRGGTPCGIWKSCLGVSATKWTRSPLARVCGSSLVVLQIRLSWSHLLGVCELCAARKQSRLSFCGK